MLAAVIHWWLLLKIEHGRVYITQTAGWILVIYMIARIVRG